MGVLHTWRSSMLLLVFLPNLGMGGSESTVSNPWTKQTDAVTSWAGQSDVSTTWTDQADSSTVWTKQ